jgi:hypothetical protein
MKNGIAMQGNLSSEYFVLQIKSILSSKSMVALIRYIDAMRMQ